MFLGSHPGRASREASILVTPPGTLNTLEDIVQNSSRYTLVNFHENNAYTGDDWHAVRQERLSDKDHPGILLFLFDLGPVIKPMSELSIWTTLRENLFLEVEEELLDRVTIETHWAWSVVRVRDLSLNYDYSTKLIVHSCSVL